MSARRQPTPSSRHRQTLFQHWQYAGLLSKRIDYTGEERSYRVHKMSKEKSTGRFLMRFAHANIVQVGIVAPLYDKKSSWEWFKNRDRFCSICAWRFSPSQLARRNRELPVSSRSLVRGAEQVHKCLHVNQQGVCGNGRSRKKVSAG